MNRQIEFRGKRIDNGEWVYGYYCQDYIFNQVVYIIQSGEIGTENYNEYEVDPSTVGQFTGLFDKNNKKIYEGDFI